MTIILNILSKICVFLLSFCHRRNNLSTGVSIEGEENEVRKRRLEEEEVERKGRRGRGGGERGVGEIEEGRRRGRRGKGADQGSE